MEAVELLGTVMLMVVSGRDIVPGDLVCPYDKEQNPTNDHISERPHLFGLI